MKIHGLCWSVQDIGWYIFSIVCEASIDAVCTTIDSCQRIEKRLWLMVDGCGRIEESFTIQKRVSRFKDEKVWCKS